jgi:hypothetical protein
MILQPPVTTDRPRVIRAAGAAPEDPDQAARKILEAFDVADREGSHPASLTMQWDDATLALDLQAWRGFRDGSLSLEAVAIRLQIQSTGDPDAVAKASAGAASLASGKVQPRGTSAPSSLLTVETLKNPFVLGGCGIVVLFVLFGVLALLIRALSRRPRLQPGGPPPSSSLPARGPTPPPDRPAVELHFLSGPLAGRTVPLQPRVRIGREPVDNDLVLEDASVSRHHALIAGHAGGFQVKDLGSSNGTFLNGMRLDRPLQLSVGDLLKVGLIQIRVQ